MGGMQQVVDAIFSIAELVEDAAAGFSRARLVGTGTPPIRFLALPGFSSGGSSGDKAWSLRLGNIVVAFASLARPDGEEAGDRTIWTADGLKVLLRKTDLVITGSGTIKLDGDVKIVRHGDNVALDGNVIAHTHPVAGGVAGASTDIGTSAGTCEASSTKIMGG